MPLYSLHLPLAVDGQDHEFRDDDEAWGAAVTALGELLQDIDGALPRTTEWTLRVTEGQREVALIEVRARLHSRKD